MLETTREGFARMVSDPWLFIWHTHLFLTFVHFITWQTTYGGVHGPGPASRAVKEFDDVVVSLMGLTGWLAVIYFFRWARLWGGRGVWGVGGGGCAGCFGFFGGGEVAGCFGWEGFCQVPGGGR